MSRRVKRSDHPIPSLWDLGDAYIALGKGLKDPGTAISDLVALCQAAELEIGIAFRVRIDPDEISVEPPTTQGARDE